MLTANNSFFDTNDEEETRHERLKEFIFIRDVIKNICKDTLNKARKSNQCYNKMSRDLLDLINKDIGNDEIKTVHYTYKNNQYK